MNYLIAKIFYKNKFVKVKIHYPNRVVKTFYEVPNDNTINIKSEGKTFTLDTNNMCLENGIATYYYNYDNPISINMIGESDNDLQYNASQLHDAINNNIVKQLFSSLKNTSNLDIKDIIMAVMGLVIVGGGFLLFKEISSLKQQIAEILELLNTVLGIGG